MRHSDIKIGEIYRHKHSSIGYAKALKVIPPKTLENTTSKFVVECKWSTDTSFNFALCKYFKPVDLVKISN